MKIILFSCTCSLLVADLSIYTTWSQFKEIKKCKIICPISFMFIDGKSKLIDLSELRVASFHFAMSLSFFFMLKQDAWVL